MRTGLLRSGYTTGTYAAAAAKAAAFFLLTDQIPDCVQVKLPKEQYVGMRPELVSEGVWKGMMRIQKDAGDDPDVTDGAWVYAKVTVITPEQWTQRVSESMGYTDEYPGAGIYITGGIGIGIVTKKGLNCPVGHYAINSVPRKMIRENVRDVLEQMSFEGQVLVELMIPEGKTLAEKTFNPRLGIVGGISILGTTGIVEPMSEAALIETIRLDIRMKVQEQAIPIWMTPGNYGEQFLWDTIGIPLGEAVKCSNFIADAMEILVQEGAQAICLAGHIGKLIKITGGTRNTHSRYGDRRMELLARIAGIYAPFLTDAILKANTTEEAIGLLCEHGMAEPVLMETAKQVKWQLEQWSDNRILVEVVTFSTAYGILGKTDGIGNMQGDIE